MTRTEIETKALERDLAQVRFSRLYRENARQVLAYALRRTASAEDAADVVAETFVVAWRRLAEVPIGDGERLWLFAVARRVLANHHRAVERRTALGERLAETLRTELATSAPSGGGAPEVLRAMSRLSADDRELLLLVSWDELSPREAAAVLGISSIAARSRLHRARRRLRDLLAADEAALELDPNHDPEVRR
jgi:RNA polymerase sigma-70 factor (ECF subfamily)